METKEGYAKEATDSFKKKQYDGFENHIQASIENQLPLIIHQRNSENEIIDVLKSFQKKYAPNEDAIYLHAEVSAIKNALRHIDEKVLAKSTLYICRIKRTGSRNSPFTWGISKPCTGCQRAIATFNIKTVVYSEEGVGTYDSL